MKKIFIIDDDKMYLMILRRRIEKISGSITIESYMNGLAAIEELSRLIAEKKDLPGVIFLDINMPVMDGWQFIERIENELSELLMNTKIYMVSTSLEERDIERASSNKSISEYIYKPISPDKLAEIIGEA